MPVFEVRAISIKGDAAQGWISARDVDECNSKVRAAGFYITAACLLNPWRPRMKPGRLNAGRLEAVSLWIQSVLNRQSA